MLGALLFVGRGYVRGHLLLGGGLIPLLEHRLNLLLGVSLGFLLVTLLFGLHLLVIFVHLHDFVVDFLLLFFALKVEVLLLDELLQLADLLSVEVQTHLLGGSNQVRVDRGLTALPMVLLLVAVILLVVTMKCLLIGFLSVMMAFSQVLTVILVVLFIITLLMVEVVDHLNLLTPSFSRGDGILKINRDFILVHHVDNLLVLKVHLFAVPLVFILVILVVDLPLAHLKGFIILLFISIMAVHNLLDLLSSLLRGALFSMSRCVTTWLIRLLRAHILRVCVHHAGDLLGQLQQVDAVLGVARHDLGARDVRQVVLEDLL